ncbi:MAG: alkaline phosphatase family protein [Prevotella sp.]|nr:alkaline phosphatase family protein [Prevotella sp.]
MKRNKQHNAPLRTLGTASLATLLLAAANSQAVHAQQLALAPRLVVNIAIDQLRTDYLEQFSPLYTTDGFRKLLTEGRVYESVSYTFAPVDRASAVTCVATGTSPHYNKITSQQWLPRGTSRPSYCVYDKHFVASPANIAVSTIGDELKVATAGSAMVFGVAATQDAAILSAGHAADGAFWISDISSVWATSAYYPHAAQEWISAFNKEKFTPQKEVANDAVARLALGCVSDFAMGKDDATDYLAVTLSAGLGQGMGRRAEMEGIYKGLDNTLATLVKGIEERVGKGRVLFVVEGTGYSEEPDVDYQKYKIPTGTFYINRTAQLLNMYLSAVYGSGAWVEAYYKNQIYLNHKLIETKKVSYSELIGRAEDLLRTASGVASVSLTPYDTAISGDLWIEVNPGWRIVNEDTNESYASRMAFIPFPVIFYGTNITAGYIDKEITAEHIAPTVAKAIRIRAPNACNTLPLF